MKILIVSWYFPPVNSIGAVRVGKLARYLVERGHDVGVVAGSRWGLPETSPLDFPLARVAYAKPRNINAPLDAVGDLVKKVISTRGAAATPTPPGNASTAVTTVSHAGDKSLFQRLASLYMSATNVPDKLVGWYVDAVRQGMRLCEGWRPDIVFSSGPPHTAALVACRLAARLGVPWVPELRDPWVDDPYGDGDWPQWRKSFEERVERYVLGRAAGLVTVTEPWSELYRAKYNKPIATVYNGYDPNDFPFDPAAPAASSSPYVNIVYTGGIYPGRRDPTPLFAALQLLGAEAEKFRVNFYGTHPSHIYPSAERHGVRHLVEVHRSVPYKESIRLQWEADVLLLLQWNNPKEWGTCPGKFFEYLGSLRPILGIGYEQGVPARLVRERSAGAFANEPEAIARHLRGWAEEKVRFGVVRRLPTAAREGLTRDVQFEILERFLARFVAASA